MSEPPHLVFGGERKRSLVFEILVVLLLVGALIGIFLGLLIAQDQTREASEGAAAAQRALILEFRQDLTTHARASAARSCAEVSLLSYLARTAGVVQAPAQLDRIQALVRQACTFIPLPPPRGGVGGAGVSRAPTPSSSSTNPPGVQSPSASPSPPPRPSPSPSPSPSCLPVVGCL